MNKTIKLERSSFKSYNFQASQQLQRTVFKKKDINFEEKKNI